MTYILIFFWWGHTAGVSQHIEFNSKASCMAALRNLNTMQENVAGRFEAVCAKK